MLSVQRLSGSVRIPVRGIRRLSSTVMVDFIAKEEPRTCTAIVNMNNGSSNVLTSKFMHEIADTIEELEKQSEIGGLVLSSASEKIFCAGLDVNVFLKDDAENMGELWVAMRRLVRCLRITPLTTVSAIKGHAIGGGCVLSLFTRYRVMGHDPHAKRQPLIGLNEVEWGLPVPWWIGERFQALVGHRCAADLLPRGHKMTPTEAHDIGLVDKLCVEDKVVTTAVEMLEPFLKVPFDARAQTDINLDRNSISAYDADHVNDVNTMKDIVRPLAFKNFVRAKLAKMQK